MNKVSCPPFNKQWFQEKIEAKGLSQRHIAKMMGISQATLSHVFMGLRRMTLKEAEMWAKILEADILEVAERANIYLPEKLIEAYIFS